MLVLVVSSACIDDTFTCACSLFLCWVWVSLGQGEMVLLKLIFGKGLRRVWVLL